MMKIKQIGLVLLAGALLLNCQNATESQNEEPSKPTPKTNLPKPADETAEMLLGADRYTLQHKFSCRTGAGGIGMSLGVDGNGIPTTPALNLHNADLSANGTILINSLSNPQVWNMDLDATVAGVFGNWMTTASGCNATVLENTTIFDLEVSNCNVKRLGGNETSTASFRLRCTKGT
jgi:hypothetical protein